MRFTVLMNTFNRAHLLEFALLSYLRQSEGDFDMVIADDGSTDETPEVVAAFQARAPFDVEYVRHENQGHRRATILNKGLARCRGDQVLFTDCDSLAMGDLIEVHRRYARPDRLLCGGYVRLNQEETEALTEEQILSGDFEEDLMDWRKRYIIFRKHLKASWQILRRRKRRPHNMGLNYSAPREALYEINGYDNSFVGWGSADGEVRERLRRSGVHPCSLYNKAIILHMWHPTEKTKGTEQRQKNRAWAKRDEIPRVCENGMRQVAEVVES